MHHNFKIHQLKCLGLGIRCQACGGNKGNTKRYHFACDSDSDNGKSIECNEGFNQCWYYQVSDHGDNYTIRECGASLPEKCWKGENMNGVSQLHSEAFLRSTTVLYYSLDLVPFAIVTLIIATKTTNVIATTLIQTQPD